MGRYAVLKKQSDGGTKKVGVLRTRHGKPMLLEIRGEEFDLERYEEDGEPTVSRVRLSAPRDG